MKTEIANTDVRVFDARRVRPLPNQPRKRFRGIKELAESIAEVGQIANGVVTIVADDPAFDAQLIDGERRLRACRVAGVPFRAEVRPDEQAEAIFVASFAANFGKQDHDAIEIAEGLERMQRAGKSLAQLGRIAGRSPTWVGQHLNLLRLDPSVREMMIPNENEDSPPISFAIAQLLVPLSHEQQRKLAKELVAGEAMSLTAARRFILRARSQAGESKVYQSKQGRSRTIETVSSVIQSAADRIGVFLDMPGADFNRYVDTMKDEAKLQIAESIDDFVGNLQELSASIKSRANQLEGAGA